MRMHNVDRDNITLTSEEKEFKALGNSKSPFAGLETFKSPYGLKKVTLISDEVTAVCPVTGQPDWYIVQVEYPPTGLCIESKSFKLYIQSFRNEGLFCEALASRLAIDLRAALKTTATVKITQKARGGVAIIAEAY